MFRNRRGTAIKCLVYDCGGFWLYQRPLSTGRFRFWPCDGEAGVRRLEAHQVQRMVTGLEEAARGFRRVKGYRDMPQLNAALRAHDATLTKSLDQMTVNA